MKGVRGQMSRTRYIGLIGFIRSIGSVEANQFNQ
jgi:hypothetical protein